MLHLIYFQNHRNSLTKIGGSETINSTKKEVSTNEDNGAKPKEYLRDDHYLTHAGFASFGSVYFRSFAHTYTGSDTDSHTDAYTNSGTSNSHYFTPQRCHDTANREHHDIRGGNEF